MMSRQRHITRRWSRQGQLGRLHGKAEGGSLYLTPAAQLKRWA